MAFTEKLQNHAKLLLFVGTMVFVFVSFVIIYILLANKELEEQEEKKQDQIFGKYLEKGKKMYINDFKLYFFFMLLLVDTTHLVGKISSRQ